LSATLLAAWLSLCIAVPARADAAPGASAPHRFAAAPVARAFTAGELLVVTDENASLDVGADETLRGVHPTLEPVLARFGLTRGRVIASGADELGAPRRVIRLTSARADFDPVAAAAELRASGRFRAATPNYELGLAMTLPSDYYLPLQWYVYSHLDQDVLLPEAWDVARGSTQTVIGIMDTGIDTGHEDLWRQIWSNPGEIRGNHLDDDHNGYVDDTRGWDFGDDDNDPNPGPMFDPSGVDFGFHGTFVAAIASASTNNAVGIAGAGWNCRVMPLKVVNAAGHITLDAVAAAFDYAAKQHVAVLNISLGAPGEPGIPEFFQALIDVANSAGVVCVAAAGNSGVNEPYYPAACERVISVAGLGQDGARAWFSNWGPSVDLAAPAELMWSAISGNYVVDDYSAYYYQVACGWDGYSPYMYCDGTSFAAPIVSGVCGLVRARFPSYTSDLVRRRLYETGDVVTYDHAIGRKLNALRAVAGAPTSVPAPSPARFGFAAASPNPFASRVALAFTLGRRGPVRLDVFDAQGRRVRALARETLEPGSHRCDWDGEDEHGVPCVSGVYFARLTSPEGVATLRVIRL
jgi:subtilisin family serine protease